MMPEMDGPTTLAAFRLEPATAAIPDLHDREGAAGRDRSVSRSGRVDVIAKPFDPMALSGTIRSIWERSRCRPESSSHPGAT